MNQHEPFAVILFESVSHALQAEKILQTQNMQCKLIPVPRQLSSDCGVCLRINLAKKEQADALLQGRLDFFEIFSI